MKSFTQFNESRLYEKKKFILKYRDFVHEFGAKNIEKALDWVNRMYKLAKDEIIVVKNRKDLPDTLDTNLAVIYPVATGIQKLFLSSQQFEEQFLLDEGVDDPGILKCVFMAGGPGAGKSFVASDIFGIDKKLKSSFSTYGLKVVNSDRAFERALEKLGVDPKELATIEKENPELFAKLTVGKDSAREQAKNLTNKQLKFYQEGRLGLIVDGTGGNYQKIVKQKKEAESLGYDTYMVFINTSLEVALERNRNRDRVLPDALVKEKWDDVQENLGAFQSLFRNNLYIVDNTSPRKVYTEIGKATRKFLSEPIRNPIGKEWMEHARKLKSLGVIK